MKALLFLLLAAVLIASDGKTPFFLLDAPGTPSPDRGTIVEEYRDQSSGERQIWLVSSSDPAKRRLLFKHYRNAEVLFSDDGEWLTINDHRASNEAVLVLYERKGPLEYVEKADLSDAAWKFFAKQNGTTLTGFDHEYVDALRWAESSPPVLLVCLKGHADSRNHTREWYCLYDVKSGKFHTRFDEHNKAVTALE